MRNDYNDENEWYSVLSIVNIHGNILIYSLVKNQKVLLLLKKYEDKNTWTIFNGIKILKYIIMRSVNRKGNVSNELSASQIDRLFYLTELQVKWFDMYSPSSEPKFSRLLKSNHRKILDYMKIDLMGESTEADIDTKFDRMIDAYYFLFTISQNAHTRKYTNNKINSHG